MTDLLDGAPAAAALVVVALVLVAEAGLLVGVALPGASSVLTLGIAVGTGLIPLPIASLTAAAASVLGVVLAHQLASADDRDGVPGGPLARVVPAAARTAADRLTVAWAGPVRRRPVRAAALAQCVGGARTLAPRIAARAGVPLTTVLRGTIPAALLWSGALVSAGATAGAALPLLRCAVTLAGVPAVVIASLVVLHRRRAA